MSLAVRIGNSRGFIAGKENTMGKYFIAWLLGVPAFVLVLFWLFT